MNQRSNILAGEGKQKSRLWKPTASSPAYSVDEGFQSMCFCRATDMNNWWEDK